MTDLTPDFKVCLKKHNGQPIVNREFDVERINSFLREAYSINARIADLTHTLRSIRPSYLSTAAPPRRRQGYQQNDRSRPLTDQERDAFDAQSKSLLRQLNAAISSLKQAEEVRNQTLDSVALSKRAKGGLGALGRWAAGGAVTAKSPEEEEQDAKRKTIAGFREAVIMFLQRKLEEVARVQSEMMEVRLGREVEKSKSVLYKSRGGLSIPYAQDGETPSGIPTSSNSSNKRQSNVPGLTKGEANPDTAELTQDQLQLFASENADLLKHYEDQMDQIAQAERSILDISELHSQLHANLEQQSEHIDQLVEDSYITSENLDRGNKELKKASERRSTAQAVFWGTVGFCSFLVVWDLVF